jgi:hypothetical protein
MNPNAIHILKKYPDKINWDGLSNNPDLSYAIPLLEIVSQHDPDKIDLPNLVMNPNAIHLLKTKLDKLKWTEWALLSENPSIFEIDTLQTHLELTKRAKNIYY